MRNYRAKCYDAAEQPDLATQQRSASDSGSSSEVCAVLNARNWMRCQTSTDYIRSNPGDFHMAFESLSERYEFHIAGYPEEWLPLTYLYDPDLPLFPVSYFHRLDPDLTAGTRPGEHDRVFGFVHHMNLTPTGLTVSVALNKDLQQPQNHRYRQVVEDEVRARLGFGQPIKLIDLKSSLTGVLAGANQLVDELWYQIVDQSFGKSLPFGAMWDPVFGLVRFIASWYSDGGRKGELIQTHYFVSAFGERIHTGGGIHVDFYLLPTFEEFRDQANPLSRFPKFAELSNAAEDFCQSYCSLVSAGGQKFSKFDFKKANTASIRLDTSAILELVNRQGGKRRDALFENYSAFNRGPQRSIIALMMLADLRRHNWNPVGLSANDCAAMYVDLDRTYQSSKVIQLYAQQCFGAAAVLPIDNWVSVFVRWPLGFVPTKARNFHKELFSTSAIWGKIERLIWLAVQARKVHASICSEILWCVRYGGPDKEMRGANPMSCKICAEHIRAVCPAYQSIKHLSVEFNPTIPAPNTFGIVTSQKNNTTPAQTFVSCRGLGTYDEYSPRDRPKEFKSFPHTPHAGQSMTVDVFISTY